jgi:hypothetical protein
MRMNMQRAFRKMASNNGDQGSGKEGQVIDPDLRVRSTKREGRETSRVWGLRSSISPRQDRPRNIRRGPPNREEIKAERERDVHPLSFHPPLFLLSFPTPPITSLTTNQRTVLATTSLISSAVNTNPASLGSPPFPFKLNACMFTFPVPFPTPDECVSTVRAIPTEVTIRFRTLTKDTSISGREKGILGRDTTFGWWGVGEAVATLGLICCGGEGFWKGGVGCDRTPDTCCCLTVVGDPERFWFCCWPHLCGNLEPKGVLGVDENGAPAGFLKTWRVQVQGTSETSGSLSSPSSSFDLDTSSSHWSRSRSCS